MKLTNDTKNKNNAEQKNKTTTFHRSKEKNDHSESYNFETLHGISLASKYIFKARKLSTSWTIRKNNGHVVTHILDIISFMIFLLFFRLLYCQIKRIRP